MAAERCPACRSRLSDEPTCPRCGCDLSLVRRAEAQAQRLLARSVLAWARGDVKESPHSVQLDLSDNAMFPRHLLAAVGDDYAKLAMLTKIGVAYQTKGKATLALPLTEFSPLRVNSWYATASAADAQVLSITRDSLLRPPRPRAWCR